MTNRGIKLVFLAQLLVLAGVVVFFGLRWRELATTPPKAPVATPAPEARTPSPPEPANAAPTPEPSAPATEAPEGSGDDDPEPNGPEPPQGSGDALDNKPPPEKDPVNEPPGPEVLRASTIDLSIPEPPASPALHPPEASVSPQGTEGALSTIDTADIELPAARPAPRHPPQPSPRASGPPRQFTKGTPENPLRYIRGLQVWREPADPFTAVISWSGRQPSVPLVLQVATLEEAERFGGATATGANVRPFDGMTRLDGPRKATLSVYLVDLASAHPEAVGPPAGGAVLTADGSAPAPPSAEEGAGSGLDVQLEAPDAPPQPPSMLYVDGACA